MRKVMIVDIGLTKTRGVGDKELMDVAGYEYEPNDIVTIEIAAMPKIGAVIPPGKG